MSKFILSAFADEIDEDLQVQMDVLEKYDISYIEMRSVYGKTITQYTLDEVRGIKGELDKRGFRISAVGSPIGKIGINEDFAPHLELFSHTIKIAKILDTRYIRMFSFYIPKGEDAGKYRDEVLKRWDSFIKKASGSGLILLHENEKDIYGDTPERCLDLIETMGCDYFKAIFDPANFVQCNQETYPRAYELLKDYIVYMHIKDAIYENHEVVPSGEGDGKVSEILGALQRRGFEGFLSLEPHLADFAVFSDLEPEPGAGGTSGSGAQQFDLAYEGLKKTISKIEGK